MAGYKTSTFRKLSSARRKQTSMKRRFGYTPNIFKETNPRTRRSRYIVVKPGGLKRVR